jgi:hypothetical protein
MTAGTAAALVFDLLRMPDIVALGVGLLTLVGFLAALGGIPLGALGEARTKRVPGERWLKFWRNAPGKLLFRAAGLRLGSVHVAVAGYRPTEMLIGTAADRLFEELPKDVKKDLAGLPDIIAQLEEDAGSMRSHVEKLERLVDQVDHEAPGTGTEDERSRLRRDLEAARDAAKTRLGEAVSALETIRLGLLRLQAGEGSVEGVTQALGSAHEVSQQIEHLISGNQEVARLLANTPMQEKDTE